MHAPGCEPAGTGLRTELGTLVGVGPSSSCAPPSGRRTGPRRRIVVDRGGAKLESAQSASSSHGIELGDTLALADALDRRPRHLIVYAIEVEEIDFGGTLIAPVAESARRVADAAEFS